MLKSTQKLLKPLASLRLAVFILIGLGVYLDFQNWKTYTIMVFSFWGIVAIGVYLPMLIKKLLGKETGYIK